MSAFRLFSFGSSEKLHKGSRMTRVAADGFSDHFGHGGFDKRQFNLTLVGLSLDLSGAVFERDRADAAWCYLSGPDQRAWLIALWPTLEIAGDAAVEPTLGRASDWLGLLR
jgi:hypothetical protein